MLSTRRTEDQTLRCFFVFGIFIFYNLRTEHVLSISYDILILCDAVCACTLHSQIFIAVNGQKLNLGKDQLRALVFLLV